MQEIKRIEELLKHYTAQTLKLLRRLSDRDVERWEYSPYNDWYRLSWVLLVLVCLSVLLHGYVWIMAQEITQRKSEQYQSMTAVSAQELSRAVAAQAARQGEYEGILAARCPCALICCRERRVPP